MAGIAFFDLDRTLLDCNSATLWVRRQVREGYLSRTKAASMGLKIGLYQLGFGHVEDAVVAAIRDLRGQNEEEIRQRTIAFWKKKSPTGCVRARRPSSMLTASSGNPWSC